MKKIDLFCLPFAGGSKYSYRTYLEKAPSFLNLIPLEYPGRGTRIKEPLQTDLHVLEADAYRQIARQIGNRPYAIYGHSMGGLLAFLCTRRIVVYGMPTPLHVFVTGTTGPSAISRQEKRRHLLPKPEFIDELRNMNGSPPELLQDNELLDYFEPILRADFKASETYCHEKTAPLHIPFTVITGDEEEMETADIRLWQDESELAVDFRSMPGNHFFIFQHTDSILGIIAEKLHDPLKLTEYERSKKIS